MKKKKRNRWDNEKYEEFRTNIESDKINNMKNKILGVKQMVKSKSDINSHTDDLCQIFIEPAKTTFGTKFGKNIKYNYRKQIGNPKPWFNYECQLARKNLRKRRRKFENNRTSANHEKMKVFDKKYKNTLDKNMRLYRKQISLELRNLRKTNSKEYRKILNRGKMKTEPNIPIESLFEYFKNLNETPIEVQH